MDPSKVDTDELVTAFQKLGEAHRSLKAFVKTNKGLSKDVSKRISEMSQDIEIQQQTMIDFAFDSLFRKKGKKHS